MLTLLALEVDVGHQFLLAGEDDLSLICEIDLDYLVAESEHNGVFGLHPFLDVAARSIWRCFLIDVDLGLSIEIVAEMLKEGNLLLELSLRWEAAEFVRSEDVCLVALLLFDVFEVFAVLVHDDFCGIVEVNSSGSVREEIT